MRGEFKFFDRRLATRLLRDESGGEVLEWALVAGLLIAAAIATVTTVGTKLLAKWTTINQSL